jgi:hypothetical protein
MLLDAFSSFGKYLDRVCIQFELLMDDGIQLVRDRMDMRGKTGIGPSWLPSL